MCGGELFICSFANHSGGVQCTITAFVRASMLLFITMYTFRDLHFLSLDGLPNIIDCNRIVKVNLDRHNCLFRYMSINKINQAPRPGRQPFSKTPIKELESVQEKQKIRSARSPNHIDSKTDNSSPNRYQAKRQKTKTRVMERAMRCRPPRSTTPNHDPHTLCYIGIKKQTL